jgi:uncharacterized integral membrane protein
MRIWSVLLLVLLALVIVFALQNTQVVEVQFFFWTLSMSRALVLLGTLVIGLFAGWLIGRFMAKG